MFGRKKDNAQSKGKGKALMDQMGLFGDLSDIEKDVYGDIENDPELEAELLALQEEGSGSSKSSPKKASPSKTAGAAAPKYTNQVLAMDRLIAEGLKDIPSDEEVSDTEDPELLAELEDLSPDSNEPPAKAQSPEKSRVPSQSPGQDMVSVVQDRLEMYTVAQSSAVVVGDSSKARRMDRGIKTLRDLLRKAQLGKAVSEEDLPPPVAASTSKAAPAASTPSPASVSTKTPSPALKPLPSPKPVPSPKPSQSAPATKSYHPPAGLSAEEIETHRALTIRQDQFRQAALQAKQCGNAKEATSYLKYYKTFDTVIKAYEAKQPIDLSQMPPPPPGYTAPPVKMPKVERERAQASAAPTVEEIPPPEEPDDELKKLFGAPKSASNVLEALQQRREKYQSSADSAKEEGNGGKQRRMGRIVKQYDDAIKLYKAAKAIDYTELPTPPGFPPIPTGGGGAPPPAALNAQPSQPSTQPKPQTQPAQRGAATPPPPKIKRQMSALSRAEQNTLFLQERQLQFKKAALKAKHNGEMELAKKYLQQAHGFSGMIHASQAGLPVDMSNVPAPPGAASTENLEFVQDNGSDNKGDRDDMYKTLEQDLIQQIRTCTTNADHFTKLGDVSTASKFDKSRLSAQRDLDSLKNAYTHGDPVPRFHYENRTFSMVKSCPDLGDNDLEIVVVRGINYGLPKDYRPGDLDTYVKYEIPFPKDSPQKGDTKTNKGTENPEYDQSFKVQIDRKSRVFNRILQSKSLKLEVYYRRGFLKGDKVLGSISIKLQSLENQCEVHDSYDLMDGRKAVGGKLEVKLRVRNPFVAKQVEEVKEKWLVIDVFERNLITKPKSKSQVTANPRFPEKAEPVAQFTSMGVLRYEKQLLDQQIRRYQGKLKPVELESIQEKGRLIEKQVEDIKARLNKGGVQMYKAYADSIETLQAQYVVEAKALLQQGNRDKAQILMTKKKIIEQEVEDIRTKLRK